MQGKLSCSLRLLPSDRFGTGVGAGRKEASWGPGDAPALAFRVLPLLFTQLALLLLFLSTPGFHLLKLLPQPWPSKLARVTGCFPFDVRGKLAFAK